MKRYEKVTKLRVLLRKAAAAAQCWPRNLVKKMVPCTPGTTLTLRKYICLECSCVESDSINLNFGGASRSSFTQISIRPLKSHLFTIFDWRMWRCKANLSGWHSKLASRSHCGGKRFRGHVVFSGNDTYDTWSHTYTSYTWFGSSVRSTHASLRFWCGVKADNLRACAARALKV